LIQKDVLVLGGSPEYLFEAECGGVGFVDGGWFGGWHASLTVISIAQITSSRCVLVKPSGMRFTKHRENDIMYTDKQGGAP
jgi:hypothetical protein